MEFAPGVVRSKSASAVRTGVLVDGDGGSRSLCLKVILLIHCQLPSEAGTFRTLVMSSCLRGSRQSGVPWVS